MGQMAQSVKVSRQKSQGRRFESHTVRNYSLEKLGSLYIYLKIKIKIIKYKKKPISVVATRDYMEYNLTNIAADGHNIQLLFIRS